MTPVYFNARALKRLARNALEDAGTTQAAAAEELDVSEATISKALRENDSTKYMRTVRRIINQYGKYVVADEPTWGVEREEDAESHQPEGDPFEALLNGAGKDS